MTSHFRQLIDALPQAVLVHRNGRPLFANARFTGLTGCPPDDLSAVKALVAAGPWQRWLTNAGEQAAVSVTDRKGQTLALRARRTEVPWKGGPAWMETLDVRAGESGEGHEAEGNLEYRALADGLPHGVLVHQSGQALYANPALVHLLGFASSREAYRANSVVKRFDPADIARITESTERNGNGANGSPVEVQVAWPGAAPLWLSTTSSRIDWQGAPAVATLVLDVTEHRRAGQTLVAQARNHRRAEEVAHIGHWEWHLSSQAITWSDGAYRIYGRTREEFQPTVKNALGAVHPADREAVADALNVALREGKSFTQEFRALSPDGTVRLCVDQVTVELDAAGNPARLLGVLMDVGDARRTEQALKQSQRLLETVLESIPYSLFVKDADSRFLLVNSSEAKSFHMTPEQMRGLRTQDVPGIDPATLALALQEDRSVLESGQPIVQEDRRSRVAAEPATWRRAVKVPLRDDQGRVVGIVGLSEDITQRVEAEQQLKAHRQLLHTVMETIPHGLFVKDAAGSYLLANTRYASAFGLTPDALQGLRTEQLPGFTPEVIASTEADDEAILGGAKPHVEREFSSPAPNTRGELHRLIKVPMRDDQGKVTAVVGIVEDVTHRREAEQRLQESEQLLKSVLESIPQALFVKDAGGRYVLVNGLFASRFGMAPEQVHGLRSGDLPGVSGAFLRMTLQDDARALETGETIVREDVQAPSPLQQGQWRRLIKRRLLNRQGEVIGIIGTTEDITQRKEAERQVLEGQRLLQTIVDTLPQAIFLKDTAGRYLLVNDAYGRIRGIGREHTVGRMTDEVSRGTPAQVAQWVAMDQEVLRTGRPVIDAEYNYVYPDGRSGIRTLTKLPFFDTAGNLAGVLGVSEDITGRKQAQEQLRASQRLLQAVFDTIPLSVFVKDREGRYTAVNRAMAELWQVRPEAIAGKRVIVESHRPGEEVEIALDTDNAVLEQGQTVEIQPQQTLPDGRVRVMRVKKTPLRDDQGAVIGLVGTAEDITERTEAVQRLRDSERLLQTVIDTLPQAIFLKDPAGRYLVVNDAFAKARGLSKSEVIGASNNQLPHPSPEEVAQWNDDDRSVIGGGRTIGPAEYPFTLPDGSLTTRIMYKLPLRDESGAVIGVLGVSEDVTERRKAEMRLRESERLLQTVFDTLPLDVWVKNQDRRFLRVNPAMARRWHATPEAMVGQMAPASAEAPEGEMGRIAATDLQVLEEGRVVDVHLMRTEPDGRRRIQHQVKAPLRNEAGEVVGIVGIAEDVTEMRRAEQELRASREQLRLVLEATAEGWWECDIPAARVQYSPGWQRLFGYGDAETPKTLDDWKALIHPEDLKRVLTTVTSSLAAEEGRFESEYRVHAKSGEWVWVLDRGKVVARDAKGNALRQVGAFFDIRARKQAENDLRASQRLLRTVFETIPHPVFVKDREGRYMAVNRAMAELWQTSAESIIGQKAILASARPGTETQTTQISDQEVMTTGKPSAFVRNQTLPDGQVHRLSMKKTPLLDDAGQVAGLVGVVEDITEQERAQEALRANQRLLNAVINALPLALAAKDTQGRYILVNPPVLSNYKTTADAMLGRTTLELPWFTKAAAQHAYDQDMQVLTTGVPLDVPEEPHRLPDGTVITRRLFKTPILDEHGKVSGLVVVTEDISASKKAERALSESQRLLKTMFDHLPYGLTLKDREGRYILVNQAMLKRYGAKLEDFVGRKSSEIPIFPRDMSAELEDEDRRVFETGQLMVMPQRELRYPDGTASIRRFIKIPIKGEQGDVTGVMTASEDITQQVRAEQELLRSKALLQAVFDTIPHDVWVKDREARYVSANRKMLQTFGRTMEAILGKPTALPTTPRELAVIVESDMEVLRSGKPTDMVQTRTFPDGSVHQFRVIKTPLCDETGHVNGLVGIAEDVTERMRSERELRESRLLLQTVFDALPLWVFVKDRGRKLLMVNRQMIADYGMDPVGIVSGAENDPADPETQAASRRFDMEVLETGKRVETAEFPFKVRGQPTRILRSVRVPLTDSQGRMIGIVGVSEDVTERKRAEQALLQTQKLESLGILAGGIAHDFNNLLTGILGNVELALLELDVSHHARGPLNNVKNASLMAAGLTRQMLAYSGGGRFELRPILLNSLVEDMAQLLRVTVPRHVNVVYKFESNLPLVEADASQLQQVIMNLITNASEAIGDRPGDVVLTTGTTHVDRAELETYHLAGDVGEGTYVLLQVADTGSGMPPATLQRIFDPFFTTKFTGRGLGLAAVLGIVRSHKGAIRVTSEVGKGTTFRILLPAAGLASARPAPALASWTGAGTVLVVDDEAHVRQVAAAMLRQLGMNVLEATGGEEAVRQVREHRGEIGWVLLDASMPGLSGPDALRAMREIAPELAVVMMSGFGERELQERFRGMNIRGFLQKPFTFEDLSTKLSAWLGAGSVGKPKPS